MMAALTREEEFFLRMLKLVNGVAPKAVRKRFNHYFPPSSLESIIKRKEKKIQYYKGMGWINTFQMDKLFPSSGRTASSDYDVTLMICLIRGLASVQRPTNGFDKLPLPTEIHDGADLARVKYYRNCLAHSRKDTLTSDEFTLMWDELSGAIIRLGGTSYKAECDHLINLNLNNEIVIDLRQELSEMQEEINHVKEIAEKCSCHDFHEIQIEEWETKNQKFVTINALDYVLKCIKEKKRVTVTGIPGVGKSTLIQHVALSLRDQEGYDIIPCRNPSEIQTHFKKERLQVFVVNDVCGRYLLNQYETDEWKKYTSAILTILAQGSTLLLSSCRLQIFRESSFKTLQLFSYFCDLSSCKYKLSLDKKIEIAEQYLPSKIVAGINEELENCEMVPLLCSLCIRYSDKDVSLFFTNPVEVYNDELKELDNESDKTKLCSLFFSIVYNGCISIEAIKSQSRHRLEEVFETFGVNRGTCTKTILENLDSFTGTYLTKCGDEYKMIHDKLFDIFCAYFGEHYQETFIKFAHNKVIYERTWLRFEKKSKLSGDDSLTIFVNYCYENDYFSRILVDIRNGNVIDVLYSQQMEHVDFRARLVSFMQDQDRREIKSLLYIRDNIQTSGVDTIVHTVCALGYDDLLKFFLTFIDDANIYASDEFPPLQQACYHGNHSIVQSFIDKGADLNSSGLNGLTPLLWACLGEHLNVIKLLLENKADVNIFVSGRSAIFEACSIANTSILDTLIKYGADLNAVNYDGDLPIIRCIKNRLDGHVDILLPHYTDKQKQSILLLAAGKDGCLNLVQLLIQYGVDLNNVDQNGMTCLTNACESGHLEIVKTLIKTGCQLTPIDENDVLPLEAACRGRQMEVMKYLLEVKVDVNSSSESGWTALMEACVMDDLDLIKLLLDNEASINQADNFGKTPVMLACESGNVRTLALLIKRGANIDQKDKNGSTVLILACDYEQFEIIKILSTKVDISHVLEEINGKMALLNWLNTENNETAELLIELGLDINLPNTCGNPPLIEAVHFNNEFAVKFLFKKGANPNVTNDNGETPLVIACIKKSFRVVSILVSEGAYVNKSDKSGNIPLLMLCKKQSKQDFLKLNIINGNHTSIAKSSISNISKGEYMAFECLLDVGLDINVKDKEGKTPLLLACEDLNCQLIQFLVNEGANVNLSDNIGSTPLHALCSADQYAATAYTLTGDFQQLEDNSYDVFALKFLINHGLDLNIQDSDGHTPLLAACINRSFHLARCLVVEGADVNISNNFGKTPLMICCGYGISIVETLIKYGAQVNQCDSQGITPLMIACQKLHIDVVDILLSNRADVNITDFNNGESAVDRLYADHVSVIDKRKTIARKLLDNGLTQTFKINSKNCQRNILITKDVNITQVFPSLCDIDIYMESMSKHLKQHMFADLYLDRAICHFSALETFPLCEMIRQGYTTLTLYLIENSDYINKIDNTGFTPLIVSITKNNVFIAEELIKRGADVNKTDSKGRTPLRWAALLKSKMLDLLLDAGACVNDRSRNGRTLLMWAYRTENVPLQQRLVNHGADVTLQDHRGITAAFYLLFPTISYNIMKIDDNTDKALSMLSHANTFFQTMELTFFDYQFRSVNDVIRACSRCRYFNFHLHFPFNNMCKLPDLAQATTLFLKEGGLDYLKKCEDNECSVCLDSVFLHKFVCENNKCSEHKHTLLDYLYSAENKEKDNLPCTLDDLMKLVKKRQKRHAETCV